MAEDLHEHFQERGIRSNYLHSEVQTFERVEVLQDLRRGKHDVVVGVNLLREGLDLPEVSLVAILDADKEGFLRSETSLVQTIGRAARNVRARVILYADRVTGSMARAIGETRRRRTAQTAFNTEHGIVPVSILKGILPGIEDEIRAQKVIRSVVKEGEERFEVRERIQALEKEMLEAAEALDFERAAELRDKIRGLEGAPGALVDAVQPLASPGLPRKRRPGRR
jgi:excinuclease ABC subunit B